jgi:hypothetical protein
MDTPKPLEKRLANRIEDLNRTTAEVAESLRQRGASERTIAAFLSMHDYINRIADGMFPADTREHQNFMIGLQEAMRGLQDGLVMGDSTDRSLNQKAVGDNPYALSRALRAALREITPNHVIGPAESRGIDENTV